MSSPPGITDEVERLRSLGTTEAATQLREIAESAEEKAVVKAARRALYLLSQSHVYPIGSVRPQELASHRLRPKRIEPVRITSTPVDGSGTLALCASVPDPDGGRSTAYSLLLNDISGERNIITVRVPRRKIDSILFMYQQPEVDLLVAEIDTEYGKYVLSQAMDLYGRLNPGIDTALPPPLDYTAAVPPEPPIYSLVSEEELLNDGALPRDAESLFELDWFTTWFLDIEEVTTPAGEWLRAKPDLVAVPEYVTAERRSQIVIKAIKELFSAGVSARYATRLEHSAYIHWLCGRIQDAKLAVYHAIQLRREAPETVSFARRIVERTIEAAIEEMEDKHKKTGRRVIRLDDRFHAD
ncbi:MAG TPA: hypothetical protein VGS41_04995 [Chthonomonadales bacterium]|nr:hypothetical protein [Chthonomonadales bacterium]